LGLSLDSEGFVVSPTGNFYVADEYGMSIYEFHPVQANGITEARFVRSFDTPDNLLPRDENGVNFDTEFSDPPTSVLTGRQPGRGYESLAISPSGDRLWALHQAPLQEEGEGNSGRRSRNLRLVEYDTITGQSTAQYIYQVESIDDINARILDDCPVPPNDDANCADFTANQQGRNIAPSALVALSDHEFLVLERDNRGIGNGNASNEDIVASHIGTKSIFYVDIDSATDVTDISLAGTNDLPVGVTPVRKSLAIDLHAELQTAGQITPEKFEGMTIGPALASGKHALIVMTDNDRSSVDIDNPDGATMPLLLDVYTNGSQTLYTPIDDPSQSYALADFANVDTNPNLGALPLGYQMLPTYIYSFPVDLRAVPEPASAGWAGTLAGLVLLRRRQRQR
ncbi:MAG: esterase-like activity of phytase family protein, partial [Planctomycetales bacterium]|nr:esterase-like activity of phytase family protein [Planctomycetales bacterium]